MVYIREADEAHTTILLLKRLLTQHGAIHANKSPLPRIGTNILLSWKVWRHLLDHATNGIQAKKKRKLPVSSCTWPHPLPYRRP